MEAKKVMALGATGLVTGWWASKGSLVKTVFYCFMMKLITDVLPLRKWFSNHVEGDRYFIVIFFFLWGVGGWVAESAESPLHLNRVFNVDHHITC